MNSFLSPGSIKVVPTPKSGLPKSTPALYYLELNLELNLAKFSRRSTASRTWAWYRPQFEVL